MPMAVLSNYSLKNYNAFKVDVSAKHFAKVSSTEDIREILGHPEYTDERLFVLGDGTNTLFAQDFDGLVLKADIKGQKIIREDENSVIIEAGAGESWIDLVDFAVEKGYSGIENLTMIPGSVGAAPVQNIAAYGGNFEDAFESLDAINIENGQIEVFDRAACKFSYRSSFFKKEGRGKYIITKVRIKLSKNEQINTSYHSRYGSLEEELTKFTRPPYSLRDISNAVARIRERKFPDWTKVGTAGSFFLNPIVTKGKLSELLTKVPNLQYYPIDKLTYTTPNDPTFDHHNYVKIAAGWLLEELRWKGKRVGNVGTSPNQALVVINYGGATAQEILDFTSKMAEDFKNAYGIKLEPEVNIVS